jgi:hypothetical protein
MSYYYYIYPYYYTIRLYNNYTLYIEYIFYDYRCDERLAIDLYRSISINR